MKVIALLLMLTHVASADVIIKNKTNINEIVDGAVCYDDAGQVALDEALEAGVDYKNSLASCRKWRDKYKGLLIKKDNQFLQDDLKVEDMTDKSSFWVKLGVAALASFGLGLVVGSNF